MEVSSITTIHHLPEEVVEVIFSFLTHEELDACFDVCEKWWQILNKDKIWKKCCIFPEKYFIKNVDFNLGSELSSDNLYESCKWRKYFEHIQLVCENWSEGSYVMEETDIDAWGIGDTSTFVDNDGNHWFLLQKLNEQVEVWNITNMSTPILHWECTQKYGSGMCFVKDKLVSLHQGYVNVYQFMNPDYSVKLQYKFVPEISGILPKDKMITVENHNASCDRYIIVGNFFVGYREEITDIHTSFLHIWNLESATKVATQSTYQQSFIDFIRLSSGNDITSDFNGDLFLYKVNCSLILLTLMDNTNGVSQISLFSLHTMTFVNVIAQLHCIPKWCDMKDDVIVIWHSRRHRRSKVTIYNVNGQLLSILDSLHDYNNPYLSKAFWFNGSKVIVKKYKKIHIITITNSKEAHENILEVDEDDYILCYFEPKFLLLMNIGQRNMYRTSSRLWQKHGTISVWDVDLGVKLWNLKNVEKCYGMLQRDVEYPGKLLVNFTGSQNISILNFEKDSD